MTTPCASLVATGYPWSGQNDSGYCYDGTYWYGVNGSFAIRRRTFPALGSDTAIYTGTSGDAEYPAIDFAGHLYCIDYRGTADVVVKVTLAGLTHTDLHSFTPANHLSGLVYHPPSGLLYAIESTVSGATRTQVIYSIDPASGTATALVTNIATTAGDHEMFEFKPTAVTSDALWGLASVRSGPHAIWRYDIAGASLTFGLDGGEAPVGPGVGTKAHTLLVLDAIPDQDVEVDSSLAETSRSCPSARLFGSVGAQHDGWAFVAYVGSTNIYEIAAPTSIGRVGRVYA